MKLSDKLPQDFTNIIFDFGGVIMDVNIGKTIIAFDQLNIEGLKVDDIISAHKSYLYDLEVGNITPEEFISSIYKEYPTAVNATDKQIWNAWNALLQPYDPARIALVDEIRKHYRTYLLSNTNFPHRIKFREMYRKQFDENLEDLFIECFYSDEMHMRKPDIEIYEEVIKRTRINPSKTLFIDDNEANITGAQKAGLLTYHLAGSEKITDLFSVE